MPEDGPLLEVLTEARDLGFLGREPAADLIERTRRTFGAALPPAARRLLDLGSGGGVPGLVLAHDRPDLEVVLLDRRTKRTDWLARIVRRLGWSDRVRAVGADARLAATFPELRGWADVVTARGVGPITALPALVAPFLGRDGLLLVAEPPNSDRWEDIPGWRRESVSGAPVAVLRCST
jgi:16S rRNA (guanine527-N7)-methyltransferase